MFALTPHMEPVETAVDIEIVTPEGIILPLDVVSLRSGIYSGDYQLSELVSSGLWKVVAKFHSHPQQSYSAEFKVKEYVLPSLEVKLMLMDSFFYVDSQELSITIKADYVTGENVDGMAYVIFGVIHQNQKNSFPSSLQRVAIQRGIGAVTLRREHITQTFPNILQLVGTSIYVSVSVLTKRNLKCPAPSRRKRSDEDDMAYLDSYEIVSRTKFPESWLWADIHLPACSRQTPNWLTAYVAKVFAMASRLVQLQTSIICDAIKFLIVNTQQPDGMFREVGRVNHGEMIGDVLGTDSDASMTAFCLIAMQESRPLCAATVNAFKDARSVVRWFSQQQRVGGGYGSTQATMMVYQAVAEYWAVTELQYNLDVSIFMPGVSRLSRYNFNINNQHTSRIFKFNGINKDVNVSATGHGEATLTMVSHYYALPREKESDCQKFNLSVQLIPEKTDDDEKIYKLNIEVFFKDKVRDATMSVLDIGLLTGFTVNINDLQLMSRRHGSPVARYEVNTDTERSSLIMYLNKVSHTRPEEIAFRIHQRLKVGLLQPAAVSVYEYYEQTPCVKFYHPEREHGELLRLCRNDECTCAEENCSMQRKGKITHDERLNKVSETTQTSRIDFVYKVNVENLTHDLSTDIYTVRIVEVIKEESYDGSLPGKMCTFLSFSAL
ncbi:Complement C3 [Larimichthys crocea]|uniref:Uncharacterized protein n=1 Tax=Larimichthys crocea TaxID=215358 RepID=A0ACD3RX24_LARCR|nr:Complement C3 [Larimichthys crocea]